MVPGEFIQVESFFYTNTGKIDRKRISDLIIIENRRKKLKPDQPTKQTKNPLCLEYQKWGQIYHTEQLFGKKFFCFVF